MADPKTMADLPRWAAEAGWLQDGLEAQIGRVGWKNIRTGSRVLEFGRGWHIERAGRQRCEGPFASAEEAMRAEPGRA